MPLHSYFVLVAFAGLLLVFLIQVARLKKIGLDIKGTPTIDRFYFYTGKIAIFTTWGLFIVKAHSPCIGYINLPESVSWIAVGVLYAGVLILSVGLVHLGKSLKVGIPTHKTTLQTKGLYRISRNPIYVGVHLIAFASCLYFPDLVNIVFTVYGIYIHHKIIGEEERFLWERFGKDWLVYSARVSRYL